MKTTYSNEAKNEVAASKTEDYSNGFILIDFEDSFIPGAIDYTNYWDSFID